MSAKNLITVLEKRFEANKARHSEIEWRDVSSKIEAKITKIEQMEASAGEPDVLVLDQKIYVVDCSPESPAGRRSLCYDLAAWESRKEAKPKSNAQTFCEEIGIELITESDYFALQELGEFDLKTSSWLQTPTEVRAKGGAIFGDRRFGRTFIYHNGAESYYASRGLRCKFEL